MSTPPQIMKQVSKVEDTETMPIAVNDTIWIPSTENVWELGTVMAIGGLKVTVRSNFTNKVAQVDRGLALPLNPRVTDDMTALYYIHEPGVLHNLNERSKLDDHRPYTFMANVLIAVNPLRSLPDPKISDIVNSSSFQPHPYSVAEMAYQQMVYNSSREMPTNQSVVISGESGAGKTESSKIVLKHLTTRGVFGKKATTAEIENYTKTHATSNSNSLDNRLIEQNPILEAFGNAKTLRNHNSSRFGKFMKLQFSSDGLFKLAGAFVETYLLEKSRLVYQVDGERNFHIFYQVLSGASPSLKSEFQLTEATQYHYLNQSNCYLAEETNDAECFQKVCHGLSCVNMNEQYQRELFAIVAGLLHMGNIQFEEEDTLEGEAAIVKHPKAVEAMQLTAKLLGVSDSLLLKVITEREIVTRNETFTVRLNGQNAMYSRDGMAKNMYGRLFDAIISQINVSLGQDSQPLPYIGVLDIFGFESFQRNDFEQLLINYTNEVLQATFNDQVFIAEMELYQREGITIGQIEWPDNRECVLLIQNPQTKLGILNLLDQEASNPKPSDLKFVSLLHRTHSKHPYFPRPHPKDMNEMFIVRHFAGFVTYTVGAFIDKNNDTIPKDMCDLFATSSVQLVKSLFINDANTNTTNSSGRRAGGGVKKQSVAAKFSLQMQALVDTLDETRCNFIRCIKPNASMKVGVFDPRYIVGQLRCQGIMQTAQVLKVGLPTRVRYSELVGAYKKFMPPDAQRLFQEQSDATLITAILWAFQVPMDSYKLGITRLFFKAGKIAILDSILKINWNTDGPRIVKRMKLWLARRRWRVALAKIISQNNFLKLLRKIHGRKDSVRKIQRWYRSFSKRRQYIRKKQAAISIQSVYRMHQSKKIYKLKKQEFIQFAEMRAAESRRQAQEALERQELARKEAELARKEASMRQLADDERRRMEAEAKKAEQEAISLAKAAAIAVKEAEVAAQEAANAVEQERQAERRAMAEAMELELKMKKEREEANKRKEQALLEAANVSANLLTGLTHSSGVGGSGPVRVVDIPDSLSQENKEQMQQLNDLLLSGAIDQGEYDELIPFLLNADNEASGNGSPLMTAEEEASLNRLYAQQNYGIQIRCPACGCSNNTANGNNCTECGSLLTTADANHDGYGGMRASEHRYYGYRTRSSMQLNDFNNSFRGNSDGVHSGSGSGGSHLSPGAFKMDTNTNTITIHDGVFTCSMHGTQMLQDENYAEYTVYVIRCGWKLNEMPNMTYWLVSHRFSVFEKLHKDLKHTIPPNVANLPPFPKKHRLGGMFAGRTGNSNEIVEERKRGLEEYLKNVLEICARLPGTLKVPELDRFLNLSRQVEQIRRQFAILSSQEFSNDPSNPNPNPPSSSNSSSNYNVGGAEILAARERARLPTELPTPLDEDELTQTEQAVAMLNGCLRNAQGDLRRNAEVQHLLKVCVQLQPRLVMSANLDNPFASVELIPRAMQCMEDLEVTMGLYNDSLLAVTETYAISSSHPPGSDHGTGGGGNGSGGGGGGGIGGPPPPFVPGQTNSYQRSYGY